MADLTPTQWTQIEAELASGQTINAIKLYRQWTGADLKQAKDVIDNHLAKLREMNPQQFPERRGKGGCLGRTAMVGMAVALGLLWAWAG